MRVWFDSKSLSKNTVRFFIYALRFDVTLIVRRYGRLHENGTTTLAIFSSICVPSLHMYIYSCVQPQQTDNRPSEEQERIK